MQLKAEDLEDQKRFSQILEINYTDLIEFVIEYLKKKTTLIITLTLISIIFLAYSIKVRYNIAGFFPIWHIRWHTFLGTIIFPIICIPIHEFLHVVPYFIFGARKIKIGMDLKQYMFYVTAHRHVISPGQFKIVAYAPFIIISTSSLFLIYFLPGLWKWSLSLFLFVHTTMCAGDFALLNYYFINRKRKIYTFDDAEKKVAYFYEEIQ
jgi:hypothetical protein